MKTGCVVVYVVKLGASLIPSGHHGSHTEAVTPVAVHGVGEELGGGSHRDALLVAEFVKATLHSEVALPVGAVGCTTSHSSEEEGVDLDDLLHCLGRNVGSHCTPGINTDNDSLVELEGEGGGTLGEGG